MLQSMTGFGKTETEISGKNLIIQLKSVNSKTADVSVKLPQVFREKESDVRSILMNALVRGKIDLSVYFDTSTSDQAFTINATVFNEYFEQLKKISGKSNVSESELFSIASRYPNVLSQEKESLDENEWKKIETGISAAISEMLIFRNNEGSVLQKDLEQRINTIGSLLEKIKPLEKERLDKVREKLENQLKQLQLDESVNRDRFEQELIYYIERLDLTEEEVRLTAHLKLFLETMSEKESQGRKLNFISQEIGRENNTIGSKANHAEIQRLVVDMKDELEKIKEQLFNVL